MKKKFDAIVVGELNVDLILNQIESFPEVRKEKLADKMTLTMGSSSAIFASNLSTLGMSVLFIGKTGTDIFGRYIKEHLEAKGVDTSMLMMNDDLQTGATVADKNRFLNLYPIRIFPKLYQPWLSFPNSIS